MSMHSTGLILLCRDRDDFHAQDHHPVTQVQCFPPKQSEGQVFQGSRTMRILWREALLYPAQNLATGRTGARASHALNSRQDCLSTAILVCCSCLKHPEKRWHLYLTLAPTQSPRPLVHTGFPRLAPVILVHLFPHATPHLCFHFGGLHHLIPGANMRPLAQSSPTPRWKGARVSP